MSAELIKNEDGLIEIKLTIDFSDSMLDSEELIQQELNNAGVVASSELLKSFDSDGSMIQIGSRKFSSKGQIEKSYKTPYGVARIARHVYQATTGGGSTYCPLEDRARIIRTSTPKLAKIISSKHSRFGTNEVRIDLKENHNLSLTNEYIKNTTDFVGSIAELKEETWSYSTPQLDSTVHTISLGLDGTCMYYIDGDKRGWREAMTGTISLYNKDGERLHTSYFASTPEYGKATFYKRMEDEIRNIKAQYPAARYIGLADGASDNWSFLENHTSVQITDFWHAKEYLKGASTVMYSEKKERENWLDIQCHELKNVKGTVEKLIKTMRSFVRINSLKGEKLEKIQKAITYFKNQGVRMKYYDYTQNNYPIGSGVTEAACKTVIKQRFCRSGMRWKKKGAAAVLSLRCLNLSNRWAQFWNKINQFGVNI